MGGLFPSSGGEVGESGEGTNGDGLRKLSFGKGCGARRGDQVY